MNDQNEKITTVLQDVVGDDLRLILRNRRQSWTVLYARHDEGTDRGSTGSADANETHVNEVVTGEERLDAVVQDLVFEELAWPTHADRYELGEPRATVRLFERGTAVIVSTADATGYLVVLDAEHDVPVRNVVDACRRTFC